MTRVTVTMRPVGRGGWSPLVLSYDSRVRSEMPAPLEYRRGQVVTIDGGEYRVSKVAT